MDSERGASPMNARLLILIVLAGGLAVYFAVAKNQAPVVVETAAEDKDGDEMTAKEIEDKRLEGTELIKRPLPGKEPAEPPNLAVSVEVDRISGKNRLYFNITESHGYYVETFRIQFWYVRPGVTGPEDSPLSFTVYKDDFLKANDTLRTCAEVVPAELSRVGGDMGTTQNWDAEIVFHGRAREKNPDPLPIVTAMDRCH
jgi:hypothetical protein